MDDEQSDDLFNENEDASSDSGSEGDGEAGDDAPPQDTKAPKDSKDSKRVNDLMSNWQKAQARANAAEAELAKLKGPQTSNGGDDAAARAAAESNEFLELAREQARTALYGSDPRFAEYGFEVTAIEGKTAKEMQASANRLRATIDKVETSATSKALREHGLAPEISSGTKGDKPLDFASMSDKEILEIGDRMLGRL